MVGVELDAAHPPGTAKAVVKACADRGLLLLNCSVFETLRFIPPLTVSEAEIDLATTFFDEAIREVL